MLFNSKTGRVALEPGDMIRCRDTFDAGELADIMCERKIPFEFIYEKDGVKGIWIMVLARRQINELYISCNTVF